ncbi:MAG: hypothetical protein QG580_273 [Patescibacteria group bacterium]|jgi:hypothetical protein|nr:hypothetical protein [Patescibacteria group bacterium]
MKKILNIFILITFFVLNANLTNAAVINPVLISKTPSGGFSNGDSGSGGLSADGRYIVFDSEASNIIAGDTNAESDVFLYNIANDTIKKISTGLLGAEADGSSIGSMISEDGNYVVFWSNATNLVEGDTNNQLDVFRYSTQTEEIEIASLADDDSLGDSGSGFPSVSSDGRYVSFVSAATNLVVGDTNSLEDVFIRDMDLGTTERVNVTSSEGQQTSGALNTSMMSSDGRYIAFSTNFPFDPADDNNNQDVYIRDLQLGITEAISVDSDEQFIADSGAYNNNPGIGITEDGRYVIFGSFSGGFVSGDTNNTGDVFLRDRVSGITEIISTGDSGVIGNGGSFPISISPDGRYIAFTSEATNLVSGDTTGGLDTIIFDIFVRDTYNDTVRRVTVFEDGTEFDDYSDSYQIFATGGRYITFTSLASNIVNGDTNGFYDVFYAEITDMDGIEHQVEDDAPNNGDIDDNGYDDAIEDNVSSFVNSVSGNYTSVVTTGDCFYNSNLDSEAESELASEDSEYDYPLGIISFEVNCREVGETATVSVYCFCNQTPLEGLVARKYDPDTGEYTTIESAVIEEVTIDGQRALRMTYDVVDGGVLDEDGLENGTIIDPVGFGRPVQQQSSGGSRSSGSIPKEKLAQLLQNNTQTSTENSCNKNNLVTLMKKGSKFGEVSLLQSFLNKNGFNSGVVDGLFGSITDSAVKAFQKSNSLVSDGIVGPITRGVINSKCK